MSSSVGVVLAHSPEKRQRICSTHEFPLPNQNSPPIHPSILHPPSPIRTSSVLPPSIPRIKTSRHLEVQNAQRELTKETTCFDQEKESVRGDRNPALLYSETFPAGQVYYKISSRHYRCCVKMEKEKEAPGPTSRTLSTRAGSKSGAFGYKQ
jgi:hypothetical protein